MASGGIEIPIEFLVKFGDAIQGLGKVGGEIQKQLGAIKSATAFTAIAEGAEIAVGAFEKVAGAFETIISKGAEAELINNQLAQALKSSGDYSEQNVQVFKDLAEQLSKNSRFDDDLILSQVRLAKQFNTTNVEAAKLISAAVDLAAYMHEDLSTAVQQLGQTLDGTVGRIGQAIPTLQQLTAEQLRNGAAIDIIAQKYKGFAANDLQTFDGALAQVSHGYDDVLKAIGKNIAGSQAVINVLANVADIFGQLTDYIDENKAAIAQFVKDGVVYLAKSVGVLSEAISQIDGAFTLFYLGIKSIYEILKNFVLFIGREAIGSFTFLAKIMSGDFKGALDVVKDVFNKTVNTATESVGNLSSTIDDFGKRKEIYSAISQKAADFAVNVESGRQAFTRQKVAIKDVTKEFDGLQNSAKRFDLQLKTDFESLVKELKTVGATPIEQLQAQFDKQRALLDMANKYHWESQSKLDSDLHQLKIKYIREEIKIQQDEYAKLVANVQQLLANPFSTVNDPNKPPPPRGGSLGLSDSQELGAARGIGGLNTVLGGAAGASKFLSAAVSAVGVALLGPVGEALGPLAEQLSKGPDAVKAMITEFAKALPDLIANLIKAIPVVVEALAEQSPKIVDALIDHIPDIVQSLVKELPKVIVALALLMPRLQYAFIRAGVSFTGKILEGAVKFVGKILEGAGKFVEKIIQGVGSSFGNLGKGASGWLGGLEGGASGFINNLAGGLHFKAGADSLAGSPIVSAKGGSSAGLSKATPTAIAVTVQISNKDLATSIIDLQKLGYKLVAA